MPYLGGLIPNEPWKAAARADCPGGWEKPVPSPPGKGECLPEPAWPWLGSRAVEGPAWALVEGTGEANLAMLSAREFEAAAGDLPRESIEEAETGAGRGREWEEEEVRR